jgi:Polyketide cyclase / dehydrase and lipid transport
MPGFSLSTVFPAPVSQTFALSTDVEHMPGRVKGITKVEKLTPGPVGLGTKFKETRIVFKREATETFEFTAFEPDQRYELTANSCGAVYRTDFRFTPEGPGTRVDVTFDLKAVSFFAKLMRPLAGLMMGMMRKCVQQDLDDLRAALDAQRAAA